MLHCSGRKLGKTSNQLSKNSLSSWIGGAGRREWNMLQGKLAEPKSLQLIVFLKLRSGGVTYLIRLHGAGCKLNFKMLLSLQG